MVKKNNNFYSDIVVFVPGNLISVKIGGFSRKDHTIINKQDFLDSFYDVEQRNPLCMPKISVKEKFKEFMNRQPEFLIESLGKNKFKIIFSRARCLITRYEYIHVYPDYEKEWNIISLG